MAKRLLVGLVTRDKALKTRRVEVPRLVRHPKYGKIVKKKTICHVHDEDNVSHNGDTVEIEESRPISALKRWRLIRVVAQARGRGAPDVDAPEGQV